MKPDKRLCHMFLLAFFALNVHNQQSILKVLEHLTNKNVPVKIFNCRMNIQNKGVCTVAALAR